MNKNYKNLAVSQLITLVIFFSSNLFADARSELMRYRELDDKIKNDKKLINPFDSYISFSPTLSSGFWDFFSEANNTASSSQSQAIKEAKIAEILFKNLNTEKFINIDFSMEAPMGSLQLSNGRLYFGPKIGLNGGSSLSISNTQTATNPNSQIYAKVDSSYGLHFLYKSFNKKTIQKYNIYYLKRQDIYTLSNAQDISGDGKVINLDSDFRKATYLMLDFEERYKLSEDSEFLFSVTELKLSKKSGDRPYYGSPPLWHSSYTKLFKKQNRNDQLTIGYYYRKDYALDSGLYLAYQLDLIDRPFSFHTKLDSEFFNIGVNFTYKDFRLSYLRKTPHTNNSDDIWVPNTHLIQLLWRI